MIYSSGSHIPQIQKEKVETAFAKRSQYGKMAYLHTVTWKTVNAQQTDKVRKHHANTNSITTSDHSTYTTSTYIPGNISLGNQSTQHSTFRFLNSVPQQTAVSSVS